MRILVTGGAGFIGTHLVRKLAEHRAGSITVLDNLHRGRFAPLAALGGAVRLVQADIRDPAALETAVRDADLVYHLAAQSSVMNSATDPEYAFHSNVTGTYQLLRLAREHGVRRVVFTSSREVYGDPARLPVPESAPIAPKNAYGASKAAGEMYCRAFASDGLRTVILRLANVYGPGDRDRVIPIFVENALMGQPLVLYGGHQLMDFVWIDVVVDALMTAGLAECPTGPLNVGSGRGVTVAELSKRVVAAAGSRSLVRVAPSRNIEVSRFVADVTLARRFFHLDPPPDPLFGLPAVVNSALVGQAVSPAKPPLSYGAFLVGHSWIVQALSPARIPPSGGAGLVVPALVGQAVSPARIPPSGGAGLVVPALVGQAVSPASPPLFSVAALDQGQSSIEPTNPADTGFSST